LSGAVITKLLATDAAQVTCAIINGWMHYSPTSSWFIYIYIYITSQNNSITKNFAAQQIFIREL